MSFNWDVLKQSAWLVIFATLLLSTGYYYQQQGITAVVIILLLTIIFVSVKLLSIHQRCKSRIEQVIKALANNDPTLGLAYSDPLSDKLEQVREHIQISRQEAEIQAQHLQTLLVHLDISILVVDQNNKILNKNPASEKLLGKINEDVAQLGQLGELITATQTNKRTTVTWQQGEHNDTLSVHISCCEIQGKPLKLVSIQSIYQELIAKEQQAYKRLTKVLTHEVANSITPLASLAQTAIDLLPDNLTFNDDEDKEDLNEALTTLASRTSFLSSFIKSFHKITSLPNPILQELALPLLIERVLSLFKGEFHSQKIKLTFNVQSSCLVMADEAQLEQVLINIIKNAIEAITGSKDKEIALTLFQQTTKTPHQLLILDINDTGKGIASHVVDQIFVPFFTTKQQGSGIGLSLSRQIMIQHGGDLKYIEKKNSGACFRLVFG